MAGRPANTGRFHALLSRAASSSSDSSSEGSSSLDLPTSAGKPASSGAGPSKAAAPSAPMGAPASGNGPSRQAQGLLPATPIVGNDRGASIPASTTEAFIEAMQALSLRPDEKLHPAHQALRDQACKLQSRIWGLRQGMQAQSSVVPADLIASFEFDLKLLIGTTVTINKLGDDLATELKKAQDDVKRLTDRVNALERDVESRQRREENLQRLVSKAEEDKKLIAELQEKLRQNEVTRMMLQDQVDGKRSLWMDVHRDPQERAAALQNLARSSALISPTYPNFPRPAETKPYQPRQGGPTLMGPPRPVSAMGHIPPAMRQGPHHPPTHLSGAQTMRARTNLMGFGHPPHHRQASMALTPTGPSQPPRFAGTYLGNMPSSQYSVAPKGSFQNFDSPECSNPPAFPAAPGPTLSPVPPPNALISDKDVHMWAGEFQTLFSLINGFCNTYFRELPCLNDDLRNRLQKEAKGALWDYVCKVCHTLPGSSQSNGERALRLLHDRVARPYLMERLILQHIVNSIFHYEGWNDYSDDVDAEMARIHRDLKFIEPARTFERQMCVDRRAELIKKMTTGPNAPAFKNHKLNQHHQHLKTIVTPLLPYDPNRKKSDLTNEALYDLFAVVNAAWELSSKMMMSRFTFSFDWAQGHDRFSAETHDAIACDIHPTILQRDHWLVKLGVTPIITARSDAGLSIATRTILKSGVLVTRM